VACYSLGKSVNPSLPTILCTPDFIRRSNALRKIKYDEVKVSKSVVLAKSSIQKKC
jgi:hypothetical protein